MKKASVVFNLATLLFFALCLITPQKVSAEEKKLPPGIAKKDEIPGKGLHKGWEQGQHKGWDKEKTKDKDKLKKDKKEIRKEKKELHQEIKEKQADTRDMKAGSGAGSGRSGGKKR